MWSCGSCAARTWRRSRVQIGVPAHQLEEWRRVFVEGGKGHLRSRGEPDQERELTRARAKVGELMMELELAEGLLKKGASGTT